MKEKFDRGEPATAMWRADGWPLPALSAEARWWRFDARGLEKVVGGALVGSRHVMPWDGVRILPLQPIWTGFVIDSVLYASLWFGLFSLGSIRRIRPALRRRRGLCPGCGYKLQPGQFRCSECGEPVASS